MPKKNIIERIVEKAKKQMGAESFDDIDEFSSQELWVSSGVPDLDLLLNTFGYCSGIMEVYGKSRSGKTTLLHHLLKEVLRVGGIGFIVSTERRERRGNIIRMGIDPSLITRKKAKTIEDVFGKIEEFINLVREEDKGIPLIIGLDSLGGTPTKAEMDAKEDQQFMAIAARVIRGRLRRITQIIDETNTILFINNQTYQKIGQMFGKKTESYGGDGLKFHRQLGLETIKIKTLKIGDNKIGQITRIEIGKSDFTMPEQFVDVPLLWGYGYVPSRNLLDLAIQDNILEKCGRGGYKVKKIPSIKWKNEKEYFELMISDVKVRFLLNRLLTKMVHEDVRIQRGI